MTSTTLKSLNETWGLYGTIRHHADPEQVWPLAFAAIAEATGQPAEAVRIFLDGRDGRHFADDVANELSRGLVLDPIPLHNATTPHRARSAPAERRKGP